MSNKAPLFHQQIDDALPYGKNAYSKHLEKTAPILAALRAQKATNSLPLLNFPESTDDLREIDTVSRAISDHFSTVVLLGTGGSSLNGNTLGCLRPPFTGKTTIHFMDNIDPFTFTHLLETLDYKHTAFLCISKSGNTVETLSQTVICINACKKALGESQLGKHFFFISDPIDSPLRHIAAKIGSTVLDHANVGGRFSALTNVGLLPAMIMGLDARAFKEGAATVMEDFMTNSECEAAKGAALAASQMEHGYPMTVMIPYIDRLAGFSSWYRQLWAESLGKKGKGSTPIRALGTVDQHSQLQLYLDGPQDKSFIFITLNYKKQGAVIDTSITSDDALAYVHGKTLGDLITAEQQATMQTLIQKGCPVRNIALSTLDETVMGALLMHFMLETVITAGLLEIDPFDQPAVEAGKIITRKLLKEETVTC